MTETAGRTSWRQLLHFFTGDRHREGAALAATVKETLDPDHERPLSPMEDARIERAAERAVVEAHGDAAAIESDAVPESPAGDSTRVAPTSSDVAKPSDVAEPSDVAKPSDAVEADVHG